MKPTQLSYPTPEQLAPPPPTPVTPAALANTKLIAQPPRSQLHHLRDGAVVLYKRERSSIWQMRFKLYDHEWHRATTRHRDLGYARRAAGEIYDRAKFKEELGIPQTTRRFGAAAAQKRAKLGALQVQRVLASTPVSATNERQTISFSAATTSFPKYQLK